VVPRRADHHALLGAIARPVLVVAGEEDRTFPVDETRRMAEAIPGAQFQVLPHIGHLAALEAPEVVNGLIDSFLAGLQA
jgi:3-oxoadipate enol-lactonase